LIIGKLLQERLTGPNSLALPYTFDVRGGGGFWAVESDVSSGNNNNKIVVDFNGQSFAMLVQARALQNGLIVMGMVKLLVAMKMKILRSLRERQRSRQRRGPMCGSGQRRLRSKSRNRAQDI
jgi:4-aminobutyrate aminotransferase-like enzyme